MAHPDELAGPNFPQLEANTRLPAQVLDRLGQIPPGDAGNLVRPGRGRAQLSW
jgi:hypothetical protein